MAFFTDTYVSHSTFTTDPCEICFVKLRCICIFYHIIILGWGWNPSSRWQRLFRPANWVPWLLRERWARKSAALVLAKFALTISIPASEYLLHMVHSDFWLLQSSLTHMITLLPGKRGEMLSWEVHWLVGEICNAMAQDYLANVRPGHNTPVFVSNTILFNMPKWEEDLRTLAAGADTSGRDKELHPAVSGGMQLLIPAWNTGWCWSPYFIVALGCHLRVYEPE